MNDREPPINHAKQLYMSIIVSILLCCIYNDSDSSSKKNIIYRLHFQA